MSSVFSSCTPPAVCNGNLPAFAALHPLQSAGQLGAELVIIDRFEHKTQGVDLIPANSVLRHVGNEHQHHIRIHRANALGSVHAAKLRHFNIQKDDVEPLAIVGYDLGTVRKSGNFQHTVVLAAVLIQSCWHAAAAYPAGHPPRQCEASGGPLSVWNPKHPASPENGCAHAPLLIIYKYIIVGGAKPCKRILQKTGRCRESGCDLALRVVSCRQLLAAGGARRMPG